MKRLASLVFSIETDRSACAPYRERWGPDVRSTSIRKVIFGNSSRGFAHKQSPAAS